MGLKDGVVLGTAEVGFAVVGEFVGTADGIWVTGLDEGVWVGISV